MDEITQSQAAEQAQRWTDYMQIMRDNPVIESAHQVNLGELSAKFHVSVELGDLDEAIETVNTARNIDPPIRRLESVTPKGDTGEVHFTSAKGANKVHVNYALRRIAMQKIFPNYPKA